MKRKFIVQFEMVFDDADVDDADPKDITGLNCRYLKRAINDGFSDASYDFFGESLCMVGLETPKVISVKEAK